MFNVKNLLDLYVYTYVNCEVLKKILLGLGIQLIGNEFCTVCRGVIKVDLIVMQDCRPLVWFVLKYFIN